MVGLAILDQPELRGDRPAVLAGDAEPQRARPRLPARPARAGRGRSLPRASSWPGRRLHNRPRPRHRSGRKSRSRAPPPWPCAVRCCAAAPGASPNRPRNPCPSVSIRQLPVFSRDEDDPAALPGRRAQRLRIGERRQLDPRHAARPRPAASAGEHRRVARPGGIEAQRIPGGIGARAASPWRARNSQALRDAVAAPHHLQPARRRDMVVDQPEPVEAVEQARLGRRDRARRRRPPRPRRDRRTKRC